MPDISFLKKNNDALSATDYYPFGMIMPGRSFSSSGYRFGFNGKENDNEVKGEGNEQDYGFRIFDPRLGRFLSVDPLTKDYPELTPYQFASNTPIWAIDLDGLEGALTSYTENRSPEIEEFKPKISTTTSASQTAILRGTLTIFGSAGTITAGIALCAVPVGVTQACGALLVSSGVASLGLGTATVVDANINSAPMNIPQSPTEGLGMGIDINCNNTNYQEVGSYVDAVLTTIIGGIPKNITEAIGTTSTLINTATSLSNSSTNTVVNNTNTSNSTNSSNTNSYTSGTGVSVSNSTSSNFNSGMGNNNSTTNTLTTGTGVTVSSSTTNSTGVGSSLKKNSNQ